MIRARTDIPGRTRYYPQSQLLSGKTGAQPVIVLLIFTVRQLAETVKGLASLFPALKDSLWPQVIYLLKCPKCEEILTTNLVPIRFIFIGNFFRKTWHWQAWDQDFKTSAMSWWQENYDTTLIKHRRQHSYHTQGKQHTEDSTYCMFMKTHFLKQVIEE